MDFSAPDFRPDPALAVVGMCEETCKWKISICLPLSLCVSTLQITLKLKRKKEIKRERKERRKKCICISFPLLAVSSPHQFSFYTPERLSRTFWKIHIIGKNTFQNVDFKVPFIHKCFCLFVCLLFVVLFCFKREREIFQLLLRSPNDCNSWAWASLKPGSQVDLSS